jgi:hypothetical protein
LHSPDGYLAGDTLKRCIEITRFVALLPGMREYCREITIFREMVPVAHPTPEATTSRNRYEVSSRSRVGNPSFGT